MSGPSPSTSTESEHHVAKHAAPPTDVETDIDRPILPPDASERDAAKRDAALDDVLHGDDIRFVTGKVDETERAAVIAVLTQVRAEESDQVKRVARRDREPWARSQRVPDSIYDLLADA
ncbi:MULTISPECIES: acyl-CoA carboxylase epsilon subunit [Leucobacter]|uniref:Uncharacterized protein n=1 Tax=Leucobacter alluvii TaxID=340321 RepID=A0ABN3B7I2_9MICO